MTNRNGEFDHSIELLRSFWNLHKNFIHSMQQTAHSHELSMPQYTILMTMMHHKEMTQKTVREITHLPKSTLSHSIDGLIEKNILNRTPVEDNRREMLLSINEKGEKMVKNIQTQQNGVHQIFYQAVNSLSDEQRQEMIKTLTQITSYFEEQGSEQEC